MESPFFSVILPIYNVAAYLERCVNSILSQDFKDYELILVDDGSTDQSPEICDRLAAQHDHIRTIHKPNGGLSSARNAGTAVAKGQYIWWVDSDDWIEEGALLLLYNATKDTKPDIVKFNHIRVAQDKTKVFSNAVPGIYASGEQKEVLLRQALRTPSKFILSAWSHVCKRQFLEAHELLFVSERHIGSEDYLFNLQAILRAESICVLESCLYYYELRMGSLTQRYKKDSPRKYTQLYLQLCAYYDNAGALEHYEGCINAFYVWHLLHGICIPNEYRISEDHTLVEGRKNIGLFLKMAEFQEAVKRIDDSHFSWKQKIQLLAMRLHFEQLFYWLYVVKPRLLEG